MAAFALSRIAWIDLPGGLSALETVARLSAPIAIETQKTVGDAVSRPCRVRAAGEPMMRADVTKLPVLAALRLSVLAAFLTAAGCSETASGNKSDDPALKASTKKSMELYRAKTQQLKKSNPANSKQH
jgi:hypothetical protein